MDFSETWSGKVKYLPLATGTVVNNGSILDILIKTLRCLSLKMIHFNSFIAYNDYNLGAQITEVTAVT